MNITPVKNSRDVQGNTQNQSPISKSVDPKVVEALKKYKQSPIKEDTGPKKQLFSLKFSNPVIVEEKKSRVEKKIEYSTFVKELQNQVATDPAKALKMYCDSVSNKKVKDLESHELEDKFLADSENQDFSQMLLSMFDNNEFFKVCKEINAEIPGFLVSKSIFMKSVLNNRNSCFDLYKHYLDDTLVQHQKNVESRETVLNQQLEELLKNVGSLTRKNEERNATLSKLKENMNHAKNEIIKINNDIAIIENKFQEINSSTSTNACTQYNNECEKFQLSKELLTKKQSRDCIGFEIQRMDTEYKLMNEKIEVTGKFIESCEQKIENINTQKNNNKCEIEELIENIKKNAEEQDKIKAQINEQFAALK